MVTKQIVEEIDDMKIFGFDVPWIAAGLAVGALGLGAIALVNQWRNEQQRIADDQAKKQQMQYQQYYNDYYANAYQNQYDRRTAQQQRQVPRQQNPGLDLDRIWVSEGMPNSQTNVIKPEYMNAGPMGVEPQPDEYDPDMIRANAMMGGTVPGNAQPSVSQPEQSDYFVPEDSDGSGYDPSAPENLEYNETTGELRPRERRPRNQSPFGQSASSGIG